MAMGFGWHLMRRTSPMGYWPVLLRYGDPTLLGFWHIFLSRSFDSVCHACDAVYHPCMATLPQCLPGELELALWRKIVRNRTMPTLVTPLPPLLLLTYVASDCSIDRWLSQHPALASRKYSRGSSTKRVYHAEGLRTAKEYWKFWDPELEASLLRYPNSSRGTLSSMDISFPLALK